MNSVGVKRLWTRYKECFYKYALARVPAHDPHRHTYANLKTFHDFNFELCHNEAEQANILGCTTFYDIQPLIQVQRERRIAFLAVSLLVVNISEKLTTSVLSSLSTHLPLTIFR